MHAFREAVERGDLDAVVDLLADDVLLHSPLAHRPYLGKALTSAVLRSAAEALARRMAPRFEHIQAAAQAASAR